MELLIGCGKNQEKRMGVSGKDTWKNLVTLDINPSLNPDYVHDLNNVDLPFDDNFFDEIHAYEVLEHVGKQGDWEFFFSQFSEFWRILKPNGLFFATVTDYRSLWVWGDPGHCRTIQMETIAFLSQEVYQECATTSRTDYRHWYKANFKILEAHTDGSELRFALQAVK